MRSQIGILVLFALLLLTPARADGPPGKPSYQNVDPAIRQWFRSQRSPKNGAFCCDEADGIYAEEDIRNGQYWARWPQHPQWMQVPDDVVIRDPNRHGAPVVWWLYQNGVPVIRCYAPGAGI